MTQTTKQTPSEILTAAREKLTPPKAWTQGFFAKDKDGNHIFGNDPEAVCFCSRGAVDAVSGTDKYLVEKEAAFDALRDAIGAVTYGSRGIVQFNDDPNRTQEEVLAVFGAAIAAAKAKEFAKAQKVVIDNLQELRAAVMAQPEEQFNLQSYKQDTECGTLFCTAGLAASLPYYQDQGMALKPFDAGHGRTLYDVEIDGVHIADGGAVGTKRLFGENAWRNCFAPRDSGERDDQFPLRSNSYIAKYISDKALAVWRLDEQITAEKAKLAA